MMILGILLTAMMMAKSADAAPLEDVPLVFVHGIKGSVLVDDKGDTRWLTPIQALGVSTPTLALPKNWITPETQERDSLHADRPLEKVRILPWIAEADVYGPWLKRAAGLGRPFYPFAYDWRRDNNESLLAYEAFLQKIAGEHPGKRIQVVCHSMGGLLTLALLHKRPEFFHSIVFVGVPFPGGVGFLPDLHAGIKTGLNSKILSPAVLFTFPSVYTLFSTETDLAIDREGKSLDVDFFDAQTWIYRGLGPFAENLPLGERLATKQFLATALERALLFRKQLRFVKDFKYPPIRVVSGNAFPTLVKAMMSGPKSVKGWDFETAPKELGDGRITLKNSLPPEGIPYQQILSTREHSDLLNDPRAPEWLINL